MYDEEGGEGRESAARCVMSCAVCELKQKQRERERERDGTPGAGPCYVDWTYESMGELPYLYLYKLNILKKVVPPVLQSRSVVSRVKRVALASSTTVLEASSHGRAGGGESQAAVPHFFLFSTPFIHS